MTVTEAYKLVVPTNKKIKTNESLEEYPLLPNSITIGTDGSLYWSDSSTNVPLHNLVVSVLGDKSGRYYFLIQLYSAEHKLNHE